MKTTIITTLLLTTLAASAQGLTKDIVIGSTTLTVLEGRIVGLIEPPPQPAPPTAVLLTPTKPEVKQSLAPQRLDDQRASDAAPQQPTPKTSPAATTAVPLGPVYDITLPSGVRFTVASTNTFDHAQLRRWLREAAQQLPNR